MLLFGRNSGENAKEVKTASDADVVRHHVYGEEIIADAFLSPIALPCDRLNELRDGADLDTMSAKAKISVRELSLLLNSNYLEPTTHQLVNLSVAYNVSILWLLGYHTEKETHLGGGDREMLVAIAERNGIERARLGIKKGGFLSDFFIKRMDARLHKANLKIASTAAHIVAREHLPLSVKELRMLLGQPVFVEFGGDDSTGDWGLVEDDRVHTRRGDMFFDMAGDAFDAYQMPRVIARKI